MVLKQFGLLSLQKKKKLNLLTVILFIFDEVASMIIEHVLYLDLICPYVDLNIAKCQICKKKSKN